VMSWATPPGYDAVALTRSMSLILARTVAVHLPLLILTAVLIWKLPSGHPWARRPASVSQGFGTIFSVLSSAPLRALQTLIPFVDTIQLTVIVLLWVPRSSRTFVSAVGPGGRKQAECRTGDA
jgi:hypothetical protein